MLFYWQYCGSTPSVHRYLMGFFRDVLGYYYVFVHLFPRGEGRQNVSTCQLRTCGRRHVLLVF
jgi:hypothetical protein